MIGADSSISLYLFGIKTFILLFQDAGFLARPIIPGRGLIDACCSTTLKTVQVIGW